MENKIDTLRKARGLTVQELADAAGISRGYLNELKSGKTKKRLNIDVINGLSRALGCTAADLLSLDSASQFPTPSPQYGQLREPVKPFAVWHGELPVGGKKIEVSSDFVPKKEDLELLKEQIDVWIRGMK